MSCGRWPGRKTKEVLVLLTVVSDNAGRVGRVVASVFPDDAGEMC